MALSLSLYEATKGQAMDKPRRRVITVDSGETAADVYTDRERLRPAPTRLQKARQYRVSLRPHIGQLLGDAYHVAAAELAAMRQKTGGGEALTSGEASKFARITDSVVKLMREERAQEDRSDPAQLSDAQLLEQAEAAREYLEVLKPAADDEE